MVGDNDNGGMEQATGEWAVGVSNPNIAGATQGSGDQNQNMDGDGNPINVPMQDDNLNAVTTGDAINAKDNFTGNGDNNVGTGTQVSGNDDNNVAGNDQIAENDDNNVAGGSIAEDSFKENFNGAGPNNVGTGTQDNVNVQVPDATVQGIGKQNADDGSTNNDASTSANALGSAANGTDNIAQTGGTNVSVPDATVQFGMGQADDAAIVSRSPKSESPSTPTMVIRTPATMMTTPTLAPATKPMITAARWPRVARR